MMHHRFLFGALLLGASAMSPPLQAQQNNRSQISSNQEVTLRVPVQLQGFDPLVTQAAVFCQAFGQGSGGNAKAQTNIALVNGAYNGNVNVKLELTVSQQGLQWDYTCNLSFYNSQTKAWDVGVQQWDKPQTGTTPTLKLTGTFKN